MRFFTFDKASGRVAPASKYRWSEYFKSEERFVAKERFSWTGHEVTVSTVFVGIDNELRGALPLLFETAALCDSLPLDMLNGVSTNVRTATLEAAMEAHEAMVAALRDSLGVQRVVVPAPAQEPQEGAPTRWSALDLGDDEEG